MTTKEVIVVKTGVANTASVLASFERLGYKARLSQDQDLVYSSELVVLPGVGTFGATMDTLKSCQLVEPLKRRISLERKTLCICVGLQVLFEKSAESPDALGLSIFTGNIRKFDSRLRVPQLGWNYVSNTPSISEGGYAYFANSYYAEQAPAGAQIGWSEYGCKFVAYFERGALTACQFHPELSGNFGKTILNNWLENTDAD